MALRMQPSILNNNAWAGVVTQFLMTYVLGDID
jgi:hypothetical protein